MQQLEIEAPHPDRWLRTSFVDDNGEVFLPCGAFDNELNAMLCASHDGIAIVQHEGHVYAPRSWLAKEYPKYAKTIETIAASILRSKQKPCNTCKK